EYAREALKNGLKLERSLGANPYKFGMVGSTDSHTGLATAEENGFFGKIGLMGEPNPKRIGSPIGPTPPGQDPKIMWQQWEFGSSGYAAVWAQENTRESLFDAMKRKEVYATTGPRITLRFFGGFHFDKEEAHAPDLAAIGYRKGVPMGGELQSGRGNSVQGNRAPSFLIAATKDPRSGNLDRIQIVKGWLDTDGKTHEKVYNVAWGDEHRRKLKRNGKIAPVGNTVDVADASWTNTIGDAHLAGFWQDPNFDADQSAVYYARVLEIPTPRWVAYDAKFYGTKAPNEARLTHQERAYSSPIWYASKNRN
ncbi:MAG: DUF3604 domain-containing protein, partial [Arenicella sp.]|nr:DUF3604 domain-containing protein [Arenicella sp.]